ncbi:aminotransferase class IV [Aureibaculum sp. 2210JD6-5]|uniref:aminotransferase class IV n=1 Tax=Aureibaculum sp. 2210JD6-5 TaxID=3103957 RepID=UPI002AAE5961|nr:aminotransferase class IV [Aureibaculum sp. 2210JD6-5]MDY7394289.1 aminotransferase class IV [Aureibaculum sp. 2210JD6-5]
MINYNGNLTENPPTLSINNRAFKYGDGLFESIKVTNGNVNFLEDHYFRLMASMRMLRMNISMEFTLEFFEQEILKTASANNLTDARVRFTVNRKDGGLYLPTTNNTHFLVEANPLSVTVKTTYQVDLFKDYYVFSGVLSTLKTNNKVLNVVGSIYAEENGLDNCILLNEKKQVVEALNANIFLVKEKNIITPPLSEGCLKGVFRKKLIEFISKDKEFNVEEKEISPFELQKTDEVFLTNTIIGIQPVTKYRKKTYSTMVSEYLRDNFSK